MHPGTLPPLVNSHPAKHPTSFRPYSEGKCLRVDGWGEVLALVSSAAEGSVHVTIVDGLLSVNQVLLEARLRQRVNELSDVAVRPGAYAVRHDLGHGLLRVVSLAVVDSILAVTRAVRGLEAAHDFRRRRLKIEPDFHKIFSALKPNPNA